MDSSSSEKDYRRYLACVTRHCVFFRCPFCKDSLFTDEYETHCTRNHAIDGKLRCVWCRGVRSWPKGTKNKQGTHLLSCFKKFTFSLGTSMMRRAHPKRQIDPRDVAAGKDSSSSSSSSAAAATASSSQKNPAEEEQHLLHHHHRHFAKRFLFDLVSPDSSSPPEPKPPKVFDDPRAFRTAWPVDYVAPPVPFRDGALNWAACNTRQFLETRDTHDWFHVALAPEAFESFLRVADEEERGKTKTLYFFRWCGIPPGDGESSSSSFHRHMIAVCHPKGRFLEGVWPKIGGRSPEKKLRDDVRRAAAVAKAWKEITTPLHFVLLLYDLARPDTECRVFKYRNEKVLEKIKPFYLNLTLPRGHRGLLPMALQWNGGAFRLLLAEKFGEREEEEKKNDDGRKSTGISIPKLAEKPMIWDGRKYIQRLEHFYGLPRGIVLPVDKRYVPASKGNYDDDDNNNNNTTPHYLFLTQNRKIYFRKSFFHATLNEEDWQETQASGGNRFYDAIGYQTWCPSPRDQEVLRYYKPLVDENAALKEELAALKAKRSRQ